MSKLRNYGKKVLWIDTETTGTNVFKDDVIQIGAILEINGEEKDTLKLTFQPKDVDLDNLNPYQETALSVSGLTPEILKESRDNPTAWNVFKTWLRQYVDPYDPLDKLTVFGYNVRFDMDILRTWWKKNNDKFFGSFFYPIPIDVMILFANNLYEFQKVLNGTREFPNNMQLKTALDWCGIEVDGQLHDAFTDIKATKALYERLKGEE